MKRFLHFYLFVLSLILFSCKKESSSVIEEKKESLSISDSCSFSINGKTYVYTGIGSSGEGNRDANLKLDSITHDGSYIYSGDKDSVYYSSVCRFYPPLLSNSQPSPVAFIFIKKFLKSQMVKNFGNLYVPNATDNYNLYYLGEHPYATDYDRENSQNGVALEVGNLSSYIPLWRRYPSSLKSDYQSNSKFEVTSYKKQTNGRYVLEAKFSVNLLDAEEKITRLESGYLRLHVGGLLK
ncbi:MAG: hypothetical protein ACRYFL_01495 [Janthinobacterium lividum]